MQSFHAKLYIKNHLSIWTRRRKMKKILLLIVLSLFLISACAQQKPEDLVGQGSDVQQNTQTESQPSQQTQNTNSQEQGASSVKEFKMTAKQFQFDPSTIEVNKGDKVRLIVTSLDVPHGIAIPEYGINQRLEPGKPAIIEFTADKHGPFTAFCSVICGSGHKDMKGKIIVK